MQQLPPVNHWWQFNYLCLNLSSGFQTNFELLSDFVVVKDVCNTISRIVPPWGTQRLSFTHLSSMLASWGRGRAGTLTEPTVGLSTAQIFNKTQLQPISCFSAATRMWFLSRFWGVGSPAVDSVGLSMGQDGTDGERRKASLCPMVARS